MRYVTYLNERVEFDFARGHRRAVGRSLLGRNDQVLDLHQASFPDESTSRTALGIHVHFDFLY